MTKRDSCQGCPKRPKCKDICGHIEALLPSLDAQGRDKATGFVDLPGRVRTALGTELWGDWKALRYGRQQWHRHASQGADTG